MAKKNRKSISGRGAVCEFDNLLYRAGHNFRPSVFLAPLLPPLRTQPPPKESQRSTDLATASETFFPRRYVDAVYAISTGLMNSDKAKTQAEHTGTVGIDEQGTPQEDEQNVPISGETEATPVQCAHGPLVASPSLGSFQGRRLSAPSVGSAYTRVLF